MRIPVIRGLIERRILVNYRVDPAVLASLLPLPFRPKLVHGFGMVGICLIRLRSIRPRGLPAWLGISSENAAHRAAVEWEENGVIHQGIFIRRRDTNSRLNSLAGGRLFPGLHHHAQFTVHNLASMDRLDLPLTFLPAFLKVGDSFRGRGLLRVRETLTEVGSCHEGRRVFY